VMEARSLFACRGRWRRLEALGAQTLGNPNGTFTEN
jgi:hypothetical protein